MSIRRRISIFIAAIAHAIAAAAGVAITAGPALANEVGSGGG
jgi:hypothetical protein